MARARHTCNDVYQAENKVKFLTAEALRGVNSTIFDPQSSRLANVLGKRDYVTGTALEQGCDLDTAVVVQRQAPMVQTVLKAQRLSSRSSSTKSSTSLSRRRGRTLESQTQKTIEIPQRIQKIMEIPQLQCTVKVDVNENSEDSADVAGPVHREAG